PLRFDSKMTPRLITMTSLPANLEFKYDRAILNQVLQLKKQGPNRLLAFFQACEQDCLTSIIDRLPLTKPPYFLEATALWNFDSLDEKTFKIDFGVLHLTRFYPKTSMVSCKGVSKVQSGRVIDKDGRLPGLAGDKNLFIIRIPDGYSLYSQVD